MKTTLARLCLAVCLLVPTGSTFGASAGQAATGTTRIADLNELDPVTFCVAPEPELRHDIALGGLRLATKLQEFFAKTIRKTPDQGGDFESEFLGLKAGAVLSVVNEGGQSHGQPELAKRRTPVQVNNRPSINRALDLTTHISGNNN